MTIPHTTVKGLPHLVNLLGKFPPFPARNTKEKEYSVPKILHFLWIGSDITEKYMGCVNSFSKMNSDYKVMLWSDRDISPTRLESDNIERINIEQLSLPLLPMMPKMAARVDYIRYVAVHTFGGIYADIDNIPLKPFDLHLRSAFLSYGETNIQNCFFGLPHKSTFLEYFLETISYFVHMNASERATIDPIDEQFHGKFTGGCLMGACLWLSQDEGIRCIHEQFTGQAPPWRPVSRSAYCRHMFDWNWKHPSDPKGID